MPERENNAFRAVERDVVNRVQLDEIRREPDDDIPFRELLQDFVIGDNVKKDVKKDSKSELIEILSNSNKVTVEYLSGYLKKFRLLELNDFRKFLANCGNNLNTFKNCICIFNCLVYRYGEHSNKYWAELLQLYKYFNVALNYFHDFDNKGYWRYLPTVCEDKIQVNDWFMSLSPSEVKKIISLLSDSDKFGIIRLPDNDSLLGKEELYPGEHLYYISNINKYWGSYISRGISPAVDLLDSIRISCPHFVKVYEDSCIFIIEDCEIDNLRKQTDIFVTLDEFKKQYKTLTKE